IMIDSLAGMPSGWNSVDISGFIENDGDTVAMFVRHDDSTNYEACGFGSGDDSSGDVVVYLTTAASGPSYQGYSRLVRTRPADGYIVGYESNDST
ncbi:unnamed protein product, partial [marine sediment metagenome]